MEDVKRADESQERGLPGLPRRLLELFLSPGRLVEALSEKPAWLGASLLTVAFIAISWSLIPVELIEATQRQALLDMGRDVPEFTQTQRNLMRTLALLAPPVTAVVFMFAYSGLCTLLFTFVLGDEGSFRQYLAVVSHAWFIPSLVGLALTPLRISTGDLQLTLNLANFMFFLPEGYLLNVFRVADLTFVWSSLIVAQGAHAIDRRRSFRSAMVMLLVVLACYALLFGRLIPG